MYIFDTLSPAMAVGARSRQTFLDMIRNVTVPKVMWDCRQDVVHIHALYGVKLVGVLDIQLAEIMARNGVDGETDGQRLVRLAETWSTKRDFTNLANYDDCRGVHMQTCMDDNRIASRVRNDCEIRSLPLITDV
jgi:exonuclease 3'-5' domain-containing protein 1